MRSIARWATLIALSVSAISAYAAGSTCRNDKDGSSPVPVDDVAYITGTGTAFAVTIPVLANDIPGSSALAIASVSSVTAADPQPGCSQTPTAGPLGAVAINGDGTLTYTPSQKVDAQFTYSLVDPTGDPNAPPTATVTIRASCGDVIIGVRSQDGTYTFTANPGVTDGIKSVTWNYGEGSPLVFYYAALQASHQYSNATPRTFQVTVDVAYYSGEIRHGSTTVTPTYTLTATWTPIPPEGLAKGITLIDFGNGAMPAGTTPAIHWSDNPLDCGISYPGGPIAGGCGDPRSIFSYVEAQCGDNGPYHSPTRCAVTGGATYAHAGTYNGTLRFHQVDAAAGRETIIKDFPLVIVATNSVPVISSVAGARNDPNSRNFAFTATVDPRTNDGPFPMKPNEWDFGDGSTATQDAPTHLYTNTGQYTVAVKVTDGDGASATMTQNIQVANSDPVAGIRVNCSLLDCTFGAEPSVDDGTIASWDWSFGDGSTAAGQVVSHHFAMKGCYDVLLTVHDDAGRPGSRHQTTPVGPSVFNPNAHAVVDAHVQSYMTGSNWSTSTGDLNGIAEPGESVVVEPNWFEDGLPSPMGVSSAAVSSTDTAYADASLRDFVSTYDVSTGFADCWTGGHCYVLNLTNHGTRDRQHVHNDVTLRETLANGQQETTVLHVGSSFTDVPKTHWAYGAIEAILHAGIDGGCGSPLSPNGPWAFCPATPLLTRAQISKWLLLAEHGKSYTPPACTGSGPFTDVPCSDPYAAWIGQLKAEGITTGTGGGAYSPAASLTRAEIAVFVVRTKNGVDYIPPACQNDFSDVPCPSYWAATWISALKAAGGTIGCDPYEYCPNDPVDRAQAASIFAKTFAIAVDMTACDRPAAYDVVPTHTVPAPIVSLTFNPLYVANGTTSTATLTLGVAPTAAVQVPLSIDDPTLATIPPNVTVAANSRVATFTVTPKPVGMKQTATIKATFLNTPYTSPVYICTPVPAIVTAPAGGTIIKGQQFALSVTASGTGTVNYQWYSAVGTAAGTAIAGANAPSYNAAPMTTTTYWVVVTNDCGLAAPPKNATTQDKVTVNVAVTPTLTTPIPQTVAYNGKATLTSNATGDGPYTYQWFDSNNAPASSPVQITLTSTPTQISYTTPQGLTSSQSYLLRVTSTYVTTPQVGSATPLVAITVTSQITFRQKVVGTANSQSSVSATWPQQTQGGDLLVAVVSASNSSYPIGAVTAPAGWQLATWYEWNNIRTSVFYYPNAPQGRQVETFSIAGYRNLIVQMSEWIGAAPASPLDRVASNGANAPSSGIVSTGTTSTTSQSKELVLSALTSYDGTTFSAPSNGFAELSQNNLLTFLTTAVYSRTTTAAGPYGHTASVGSSAQYIGVVVTFRSADSSAALNVSRSVLFAQLTPRSAPSVTR